MKRLFLLTIFVLIISCNFVYAVKTVTSDSFRSTLESSGYSVSKEENSLYASIGVEEDKSEITIYYVDISKSDEKNLGFKDIIKEYTQDFTVSEESTHELDDYDLYTCYLTDTDDNIYYFYLVRIDNVLMYATSFSTQKDNVDAIMSSLYEDNDYYRLIKDVLIFISYIIIGVFISVLFITIKNNIEDKRRNK